MIQIIELFGGVGAPKMYLERNKIPHKSIDYVELMQNRVKAYNAMFPFKYRPQDIRKWNLQADILVHGSPCQDNSAANLNDDKGRSLLMLTTVEKIRLMGEWRPKVVIWENVKGALFKKKRPIFDEYLKHMKELGYTSSYQVLNAMDFGIPQTRERVFCVSILGDVTFDFSKLQYKPLRPMSDFRQKDSEIEDIEKYVVSIPSMLNRIKDLATPEDIVKNKAKFRYIETIVNTCNTLTERPDRCPSAGVFKMEDGRYRYPTEREWWRLMDFDDKAFDLIQAKFPSKPGKRNATLYALGGNSIVVSVIGAILDVVIAEYLTVEKSELSITEKIS